MGYSGGTPQIQCPYTAASGEYVYVLHRYKEQPTYDGAGTCVNGYIFDNQTKQIITDTLESRHYVTICPADHAGRHTITPHTDGKWEEDYTSHEPQVNYAAKYKTKSSGKGAMLRLDNSGCLFHMGKGPNDGAELKKRWTTGCVLLGSNPNGENAFPGFTGVSGPGSSSPDAHAQAWMNFYDNVYPHIVKGETVVLYTMEDSSIGHPGGTGSDGSVSSTTAGANGGYISSPLGVNAASVHYSNGKGTFSGTEWGTPIDGGDAAALYKFSGKGKVPGVIVGTHIRQY